MIFVSVDTVLNRLAGNPGKVALDRIFQSVESKTVGNWLSNRNQPTPHTKTKILGDIAKSLDVNEVEATPLLDQVWAGIEDSQDHIIDSPWHTVLSSAENSWGIDGASLFLPNSFAQLKSLESNCSRLDSFVGSGDFQGAMKLLEQESECFPLFNESIFGSNWLDQIDGMGVLWQYLLGAEFNSFFYLLAFLDCSFAARQFERTSEPYLAKYIPSRSDGKWSLPLHVWFDELLVLSGEDSYSQLAQKLAGDAADPKAIGYNMYRWRRGKPLPPWGEIATKLEKLEQLQMLSSDTVFLLLVQFSVARTVHAFHLDAEKRGFSDDMLVQLYACYPEWFEYHRKLNGIS
jgi:hypothetical protein